MKTARDSYPDISDEIFQKATDWMCETYSYVPYMEPARNGFMEGHKTLQEENKKLREEKSDLSNSLAGTKLRELQKKLDESRVAMSSLFETDSRIIKQQKEEIENLTATNDRYRKALEFYADPESYCLTKNVRPRIPWENRLLVVSDVESIDSVIFPVGGKRAREALSDKQDYQA